MVGGRQREAAGSSGERKAMGGEKGRGGFRENRGWSIQQLRFWVHDKVLRQAKNVQNRHG